MTLSRMHVETHSNVTLFETTLQSAIILLDMEPLKRPAEPLL